MKDLFNRMKGRRFIFVEPGGNQGDKMIYQGAEKLADQVGLKHRRFLVERGAIVPRAEDASDVIYLHGGGGWASWWNWTPQLLRFLRRENRENLIIVGPSTVDLDEKYVGKYLLRDALTIVYARELTTYRFLERLDPYLDLNIDHDTALHLKHGDGYLEKVTGQCELKQSHRLLGIRGDAESLRSLPSSIDPRYFDIIVDPCVTRDWGRLHLEAKEIVTDRSHSAILGAILGKPTTLIPGKYHKNKSIWDYSLKAMGVKWLE